MAENLALIQFLGKKKADPVQVKLVLESLGILAKKNAKPHLLSQGEQQRAAITLAVINQPKLILADEPTDALETKTV